MSMLRLCALVFVSLAVPAGYCDESPLAESLSVVAPINVGYSVPMAVRIPARGPMDPYHMLANNGTLATHKLLRDINSPNLGWGSGRKAFTTFDLNGKVIFAEQYGLWLNDTVVPNAKDPNKNDLDIPDGAKFKNGTVVAPRLIKPGSESRIVLENITFITDQAAVAEDQKLPIRVTALSQGGQLATVSNLSFSVTDPSMGTFVPRVATDPAGINGYFVPLKVGQVVLEVTGTNRKGVQISGSLTIEIVGGAATVLRVESLEPVDQ